MTDGLEGYFGGGAGGQTPGLVPYTGMDLWSSLLGYEPSTTWIPPGMQAELGQPMGYQPGIQAIPIPGLPGYAAIVDAEGNLVSTIRLPTGDTGGTAYPPQYTTPLYQEYQQLLNQQLQQQIAGVPFTEGILSLQTQIDALRYKAEVARDAANKAYQQGLLDVAREQLAESQRASQSAEALEQQRLNLEKAQFQMESFGQPGKIFESWFAGRGEAPPGSMAAQMGWDQGPTMQELLFGQPPGLPTTPPPAQPSEDVARFWNAYYQSGSKLSPEQWAAELERWHAGAQAKAQTPAYTPQQQEQLAYYQTLSPEMQARVATPEFKRWLQGTASMAGGGRMTIPEPSYVVGQSGNVYASLAEAGPEKVIVKPQKTRSFQGGGNIDIDPFLRGDVSQIRIPWPTDSRFPTTSPSAVSVSARDPDESEAAYRRRVQRAVERTQGIQQAFASGRGLGGKAGRRLFSRLRSLTPAKLQNIEARILQQIQGGGAGGSPLGKYENLAWARGGLPYIPPQSQPTAPVGSLPTLQAGGTLDLQPSLPPIISDLYGKGFPEFPWLTALGQGMPLPFASFGGAMQGVPLPSLQQWSRMMPSERLGTGSFFRTQLGLDPQDVLWAMEQPFTGLRSAPYAWRR